MYFVHVWLCPLLGRQLTESDLKLVQGKKAQESNTKVIIDLGYRKVQLFCLCLADQ